MGRTFQDIEASRRLTSDFAKIMQRRRYYDQQQRRYDQQQRRYDQKQSREDELFEYKQKMDRRRIQREDEVYEQKQMVDRQERRKERAGAGVVRIMASDLSTEEKRKAILGLQEEFKNIDLAGSDAGRSMFGAYGMFGGRNRSTPGELTEQESLAAKYSTARQSAVSAENWQLVTLYDKKLARAGMQPRKSANELEAGARDKITSDMSDASYVSLGKDLKTLRDAIENDDAVSQKLVQDRLNKNPRYLEIQKNIEGGLWLSRMKGGESGEGGDFKTLVKGKPEQRIKGRFGTFDDRYGSEAYKLALTEAMVEGGKLGLSSEQITAGFNEWWDKEHEKNIGRWQTYADRSKFNPQETVAPAKGWTPEQYGSELMGMYDDILGGPKKPTPEELRAENTKEAYEKGKKLGYWK